ncbi:tRNA lysidine(34) synthetase TilS [Tenacibaculum sp. M341]|uniref:tRNA lysidine(34) synthetase TilS n=1 Tax=Tenacibaculum sp. M341 TaxID=2530339 RepID=UPI00104DB399|nr:tRNA lysidine(34) synthetase TilS [Tenacibaculum sp. M341]TCI91519.1 tRNA lysidine(34) synthetase TilS [Tenacibaculum sp. M341]
MQEEFANYIKKEFSFLRDEKVLVAISGGLDSVVLAYLLNKVGFEISLAHCNFQLRGEESDLDEKLVEVLSEKLNVKLFKVRFDTNSYASRKKESIQIAARNLRYDWFEKISLENKIKYIATAHHLDDSLETFLINFSRGTGIEGLTGIPKQNGKIIRPLLPFSREQIFQYAKQHELSWREDASNKDVKYTRNKIRHQVVPVLKEINPNILNGFQKMVGFATQGKNIINDRVEEVKKQVITVEGDLVKLNIKQILTLSAPKSYLYYLLKEYNFTEWDNIFDLLSSKTGKKLYSETHVLLKNREYLLLTKLSRFSNETPMFKVGIGETPIGENMVIKVEKADKNEGGNKNCILVNKNLVTFPMIIRRREQGDIFYPKGMLGKKKVSKYFKDEKLSMFQKNEIWLLCNNNNDIIWIVGMRQDRRFAVSDTSKLESILRISI